VNWLNEILYLEEADRLVCDGFHIDEVKNDRLCARVETGERNRSETHIKAVTFRNLKIRKTARGLDRHICLLHWSPLRCEVLLLIWEGRLPHGNQAHWDMDSTQQLQRLLRIHACM
jgi:hypothetical protein